MNHQDFILDFRESWPLWTVQKVVSPEGVWVEIRDLPPMESKGTVLYRLLEEIKHLEHVCLHDGIKGWLCAVRKDNVKMHRVVGLTGASPYEERAGYVYYGKIAGLPLPYTLKHAVTMYGQRGSHATH